MSKCFLSHQKQQFFHKIPTNESISLLDINKINFIKHFYNILIKKRSQFNSLINKNNLIFIPHTK